MRLLDVIHISKTFEDKLALNDVSFSVNDGETVGLLGPSGCGKTTLLRVIAGLETPSAGKILLQGQDISSMPPYERGFGLMFQDFALFPHKNVFDNVAFGLRLKQGAGNNTEQAIRHQVRQALALVGLEGFERRNVTDLSGGEAQRVALARSLAPRPRLLMLDEPLGSLDRALRERLMLDLREILSNLEMTTLYITHDQAEVFSLADRTIIMNAGSVEQVGPPEEIYRRPATPFVAQFLGMTNMAKGTVRSAGLVDSEWGKLLVDTQCCRAGDRVKILIRSEAAQLVDNDFPINAGTRDQSEHTVVSGQVLKRSFRGGRYRIRIQPQQGPPLTFELSLADRLQAEVGDWINVELVPAGIVLFQADARAVSNSQPLV
jgi:ABC-type Fe3+/spermidine/putrescine transport system ATPase subunit